MSVLKSVNPGVGPLTATFEDGRTITLGYLQEVDGAVYEQRYGDMRQFGVTSTMAFLHNSALSRQEIDELLIHAPVWSGGYFLVRPLAPDKVLISTLGGGVVGVANRYSFSKPERFSMVKGDKVFLVQVPLADFGAGIPLKFVKRLK